MFASVLQHFWDIQTGRPKIAAADVADGDDLELGFVQKLRRVRAHIAKTLQSNASLGRLAAHATEQFERAVPDAAPRGFFPAGNAVELDRLAGDATGAEPVVLLILV